MGRMRLIKAIAAGLLCGAAMFGLLQGLGLFLAARFDAFAKPRPPERKIVAAITSSASLTTEWEKDEPLPPGTVIAKGPGSDVRRAKSWTDRITLIEIRYNTPIDIKSTADISARLDQQQIDYTRTPETGGTPNGGNAVRFGIDEYAASDPVPVRQLGWPLVLRMEGLGLDWTANDIAIKEGTGLPVTEHWMPRAKEAGEYVLRFPLKDINHAAGVKSYSPSDDVKVTINGMEHTYHGSDDVPLPISVWEYGVPARWYDRVKLLAAFVTGLGVLMAGLFGKGWAAKLFGIA